MSARLRFIHLSDSHLGYRQYGLNQRLIDWSNATREAIEYAVRHRVDFVVHSGDLFHSNLVDHTTLIHAIQLLTPLHSAHIPFFVIDGNHDRKKGSQTHTANGVLQYLGLCQYLAPEGESLDKAIKNIGDISVVGLGYSGIYLKSKLEGFYDQIPDGPNVILLHADVERYTAEGYPDVSLAQLETLRPKAGYLALGHPHNKFSIEDWIFNPGSPEYYRFSDCEVPRIFYDVVLEDGRPEVSEVPVRGARRMLSVNVELSDPARVLAETLARLDKENEDAPLRDSLLRLVFVGKTAAELTFTELRAEVQERYAPLHLAIEDKTVDPEGSLSERHGTVEELELETFERSFSRYGEHAPHIAAFARAIMNEIADIRPRSAQDAEPIAQQVSAFRRENI